MKKNIKIISVLAATLLVSCQGGGASSSISTSSEELSNSSSATSEELSNSSNQNTTSLNSIPNSGSSTFSDIINVLGYVEQVEALNANSAKINNTITNGSISYEMKENYELYDDYSSYSSGTCTQKEEGKDDISDNFIRRKGKIIDKYSINNEVYSYPMYVSIIDFESDLFARYDYQDKTEKIFILNSDEDATSNNLTTSQYVLAKDFPIKSSSCVAYDLKMFIASSIAANSYVSQLGKTKIDYEKVNDNYKFTFSANYNYSGDLNDNIYVDIQLEFTLSNDFTKVYNAYYKYEQKDVNISNSNDFYISSTEYQSSVTYGEKKSSSECIVALEDYFVSTINDVDIYARISGNDKLTPCDSIPSTATYLTGVAKDYAPSKATDLTLINTSSSNESVVTLDNGMFKVVGSGNTELVFSYYGKDANGVYQLFEIKKQITVLNPVPEKIGFNTNLDVVDNTLIKGKKYTYGVYVLPLNADQEVIPTSSDEDVLTVTYANGQIVINAVGAGEATITITPKANDSISASKTFKVIDDTLDFEEIICTKTYTYEDIYGKQYTFTMTFSKDGHGSRIQHINSSNTNYTDTFDYVINGNEIQFSNWSSGTPEKYLFAKGTILEDGNKIVCALDESDSDNPSYKTYTFIGE